ncbi:MAG: PD-(D/E)XK nuclease family protein [Gemmatimonadetes bacterium]|nr:PD-(D/E)XK nuclease family protein [Gemmatimonadota bacterium]
MDRAATDGMTRDEELVKLVGDSGFLRYHGEYAKRRAFNAFDVLRYAEYEIRHSNVMAWLLDPGETHGIGRGFLEWFLGQARLPGKLPAKIVRGDGGQTVRVERELHYVDVTIFLESDQGRHIVAIENKPGWASPEHYDQVRAYAAVLREKYRGHEIHNVLLSSSREGIEDEDEIAHVSWRDVGAQIETMHDAGVFGQGEVAAFIRQYLVAVGRMIGPEESDADYFRKLLDNHHSLLKHMSGVLGDEGGDHKVRAMVPERHAHYRDTVVRLAKDFEQEPTRLRDAVREMLTSRGIKTTKLGQWLNWELEAAQALGIPWCFRWQLAFQYRQISVLLEVRSHCRKAVKDLLAFVRETPMDRHRRDRYPMRPKDFGYFNVYRHQLVGDEILSGTSTAAVTEAVRQAVTEFLDAEDSDYTRINDYFRCLAFRPEAAAAAVAEKAE